MVRRSWRLCGISLPARSAVVEEVVVGPRVGGAPRVQGGGRGVRGMRAVDAARRWAAWKEGFPFFPRTSGATPAPNVRHVTGVPRFPRTGHRFPLAPSDAGSCQV